jgi:mono/diheme cytochrome c family protein
MYRMYVSEVERGIVSGLATRLISVTSAIVVMFLSAAAHGADNDMSDGKRLFTEQAQPPCALCHTLSDAKATGEIGPNLDKLQKSEEQVRRAVANGIGIMPAYGNLSDEEIAAVARYVASVAGKTK